MLYFLIQSTISFFKNIQVRTLLTVPSHKASAAGALSRDVVTVSAIPALTGLRTVLPVET